MSGELVLCAALALAAGAAAGPRFPRASLGLNLLGSLSGFAAALGVLLTATAWEWRAGFTVGGEPVHLRLDGISAIFLALLCMVGGCGAAYAHEYWSDRQYPASAPRGRAWWCGLMLSMGLVLLASNGLHFLIGWELFTVCAYFLITLDRQRAEVRAAGWLYLAASHFGTVWLFAFFCGIGNHTGSWDLGPMRDQQALAPLFWLALVGFGVKAGVFPVHVWLPSAHANAPSHVSAILSGVAVKMGIYGLVRFTGWMPVPESAGWVVLGLGAASAVLGIAFAIAQNDLKRLLAYCSVENVGVILIGLGGAMMASAQGDAPWGRLALAGALLHVWNHGLFKSMLFLGAGSVLHATGTRELSRLGGLWRNMPWTAGIFGLGCLAVAGLPPLNGFVSEWLIYLGLFDASSSRGPAAWAAMPAAILLAISGALALATFVKAAAIVFLGSPRTQAAEHVHECGIVMRRPMILLGAICLLVGLGPGIFWPAISAGLKSWNPAWVDGDVASPLTGLGLAHPAIAGLLLLGGVMLWRKVQKNGLRRGMTWDCGYAQPEARMQYTGGSFSDIVQGWFEWLLQPERKVHRLRGLLPTEGMRVERIPETVLEKIVMPVGGVFLKLALSARQVQHGRLQSYILYLVGGLIALGVMVWWGGGR